MTAVFGHDRLGRLLSAANASATVTRAYDAAGRLTSEAQALASGPFGTFTYQYHPDGNLSRHTRPNGTFIDYAWNARNLLSGITADAPPPVASYTYNGRNQIAATESGSAEYQYYAFGRRTKRAETVSGVTTVTWFFTNGRNVECGKIPVPPRRL